MTVVCGGAQTPDNQNDTIVNPTLLVEVLSKSTEAYDRGSKAIREAHTLMGQIMNQIAGPSEGR